jgi:tagatose 1,6-diphosphate aldolase
VLKIEVPINMKFVGGARANTSGQTAYSHNEAKQLFLDSAKAARRPFIYLSAGVSNEEFTEALALAAESGVNFSGVLCGRATWKDGIPIYAKQGAEAFRKWLEAKGVENIENVNTALKPAMPWFAFTRARRGAGGEMAAMGQSVSDCPGPVATPSAALPYRSPVRGTSCRCRGFGIACHRTSRCR